MAFIDEVKKVFQTPKDHEPRILLVGATDKANFDLVWSQHQMEDVIESMDENASKQGMSYSPVFIVVNEGKGGHLDTEITLPLQAWSSDMRVDESLLQTQNTQRITDWLAGFMEPFCMNNSISAIDIKTGLLIFGDPKGTVFKMDNVMKSIRPKKDKNELMSDAIDIGSVDDILAGQMSVEEMDRVSGKTEDLKMKEETLEVIETVSVTSPDLAKLAEMTARATQQDIVDKYGFKALEDILARTGQTLLVKKPKKKV